MRRRDLLIGFAALGLSWPTTSSARLGALRGLTYRPPMPRIPRRVSPPVRTITPTKIARAQKSLMLSKSSARAALRRNLNARLKKSARMGREWNAHHMIYHRNAKHPVMKDLARGGFDINGVENGLRIPAKTHRRIHSALQQSDKTNALHQKSFLDRLANAKHLSPTEKATLARNQVRDWKYDVMGWDKSLKSQFKAVNPDFPYRAYEG